ncbi:hypothetical protein [Pseudomonas syringae]|uniref:Uncharacterized protein n=3 Tax=Pseudomonas syringae group TaxID=136849 RepID=A0A9Q4A3W4_PSESX|nr:hypothetical protein [Pseudomonas syringae]KTB56208.1 hypothetical protein AO067_18215 [Pseudomonas viridiflava ICMP 13104]MCF5468232.1 hypothetical protein [Pseudomonas syringae]MCF5472000.1 hypothetical protein [Pseudomonas syringae]MCF5482023.1 hypothetical protein [Pseudomonas syringae]MCF5487073.1 hypothetical protein [Pseudomonas syringae]
MFAKTAVQTLHCAEFNAPFANKRNVARFAPTPLRAKSKAESFRESADGGDAFTSGKRGVCSVDVGANLFAKAFVQTLHCAEFNAPFREQAKRRPVRSYALAGRIKSWSLFAKALMAATRLLLEKEASAQWM